MPSVPSAKQTLNWHGPTASAKVTVVSYNKLIPLTLTFQPASAAAAYADHVHAEPVNEAAADTPTDVLEQLAGDARK